jgi:hypothetical protein
VANCSGTRRIPNRSLCVSCATTELVEADQAPERRPRLSQPSPVPEHGILARRKYATGRALNVPGLLTKLNLRALRGFAGCANTLHARGPTNLEALIDLLRTSEAGITRGRAYSGESGFLPRLRQAQAVGQWRQPSMSVACVVTWSQRYRATGSAAARPMGGIAHTGCRQKRDWLLTHDLRELADWFKACGVSGARFSSSGVRRHATPRTCRGAYLVSESKRWK